MNRILPALLLALTAATAAKPDSLGWVFGRVTDRTTGEPLGGADVLVVGMELGTSAWPCGDFDLKLPAGLQRLEAWSHRYRPETLDVTVTANATAVLDFALWPDTLSLTQEAVVRRAGARYDSIRPIIEATEWDVTVVDERLFGNVLRAAFPALADSARVRALRTWKADTGTYYVREHSVDHDFGDTATANYLLVEDGRCTAVLQRWRRDLHRVINPTGGAIVYWPEEPPWNGWRGWDGTPLDRPGRLRLLLQVEGQPPNDQFIF